MKIFWYACFIFIGIVLGYLTFFGSGITFATMGVYRYVFAALLAFFCEYMDSAIGMGYGTTLTPILIILGFQPLEIVPIILATEMVTGVGSGLLHHKEGNVNFDLSKKPIRVVGLLSLCSVLGVVLSVIGAVSLPKDVVNLYIAVMLLVVGLFLIFGKKILGAFSWFKLIVLGSVAAFNKGISGGGYGPLLTGGQILTGVEEKESISITSATEGVVCFVGLLSYIILSGFVFNWSLSLALMIGACMSVPFAVKTVKYLPPDVLKHTIGYSTLYLGILALSKIVIKFYA